MGFVAVTLRSSSNMEMFGLRKKIEPFKVSGIWIWVQWYRLLGFFARFMVTMVMGETSWVLDDCHFGHFTLANVSWRFWSKGGFVVNICGMFVTVVVAGYEKCDWIFVDRNMNLLVDVGRTRLSSAGTVVLNKVVGSALPLLHSFCSSCWWQKSLDLVVD